MTEALRQRKPADVNSRRMAAQAVILAGGLGTRMRPVTETIPKPMIPVAGKPFLQHQLELLRAYRIRDVLLLVAYRGKQIEGHFGDGAGLRCRITYLHEASPLGTGGALQRAGGYLRDSFVLLNGDTYLAIDYGALMAKFAALDCMALIVAYKKSSERAGSALVDSLPDNLIVLDDGRVSAYRKRDPQGMTHIDAGVIVLAKEILGWLPEGRAFSLEEEIYPRLIAEGQMRAWVTSEPFYDMGSPEGLAALEAKLQ
jgi:NDP-sugar pyrophosphorylase family protein